eukprot:CAMPEP_0117431760 /NCGR_PEP_ID=MMETSP0758-20121206/11305_1 /TAXON_ID=63605 /ORGANISM="Percolomonas cosmopolitus, Strain AE-1 (ATCC 50343)" /LENGTH=538 /DNA_ID=CAMNT_0005221113 /DNA_START=357 /DNA_END=1973 /DNA_ORIENTATION=+
MDLLQPLLDPTTSPVAKKPRKKTMERGTQAPKGSFDPAKFSKVEPIPPVSRVQIQDVLPADSLQPPNASASSGSEMFKSIQLAKLSIKTSNTPATPGGGTPTTPRSPSSNTVVLSKSTIGNSKSSQYLSWLVNDISKVKKTRAMDNWFMFIKLLRIQKMARVFELDSDFIQHDMMKRSRYMLRIYKQSQQVLAIWRQRQQLFQSIILRIEKGFRTSMARAIKQSTTEKEKGTEKAPNTAAKQYEQWISSLRFLLPDQYESEWYSITTSTTPAVDDLLADVPQNSFLSDLERVRVDALAPLFSYDCSKLSIPARKQIIFDLYQYIKVASSVPPANEMLERMTSYVKESDVYLEKRRSLLERLEASKKETKKLNLVEWISDDDEEYSDEEVALEKKLEKERKRTQMQIDQEKQIALVNAPQRKDKLSKTEAVEEFVTRTVNHNAHHETFTIADIPEHPLPIQGENDSDDEREYQRSINAVNIVESERRQEILANLKKTTSSKLEPTPDSARVEQERLYQEYQIRHDEEKKKILKKQPHQN